MTGSSRLKILVAADVDPTNVIGGAERALAGQLNELAARGHTITVLTRRRGGCADESEAPAGYRIVRYPMPEGMGPHDLLRALFTIRSAAARVMRQERPDIVYVQQPMSGAGALLAARSLRAPGAYQFHSPWSDEYRLRLPKASANALAPESVKLTAVERVKSSIRRNIEDMCVRQVNRVLVLSRFMRERCRALHPIPESRFAIVPGGVDIGHFNAAGRKEQRATLGLADGDPMLLTVRNLEPRMGISNLIAAMPSILEALPRAMCVIGGSGPLLPELQAQCRALGLEASVRFAGFIPEVNLPGYYAAADLFVLPTTALEGFGMVTVEALSCGTPVAGTPVGATPEILNGLSKELVFAGVEPQHISERCIALLSKSERQTVDLRVKCRNYVESNYSWSAVVDGIETALHGCLVN